MSPTLPFARLPHYDFPVDEVRHWIACQGGSGFTLKQAQEAGVPFNGSTSQYLRRLCKKGELGYNTVARTYYVIDLFLMDHLVEAFLPTDLFALYLVVAHDCTGVRFNRLEMARRLYEKGVRAPRVKK